jgi:hypothetical protein
MKILAIGDPHGKLPKNLDSIVKKNKIEVIVCTGDIPFSPEKPWLSESWTKEVGKKANESYLEITKKLCSYKIPVIVLKGNYYIGGNGAKFVREIFQKYNNLHHRILGKVKLRNKSFVIFDDAYVFSSKREQTTKRRESRLNKLLEENRNSILISHSPPYGVVDKAYNGKHVGSKIVLEAIRKYKPKLVLCGHIHEAKGKARIGKTEIYNLGSRGSYKILEI